MSSSSFLSSGAASLYEDVFLLVFIGLQPLPVYRICTCSRSSGRLSLLPRRLSVPCAHLASRQLSSLFRAVLLSPEDRSLEKESGASRWNFTLVLSLFSGYIPQRFFRVFKHCFGFLSGFESDLRAFGKLTLLPATVKRSETLSESGLRIRARR